MRTTSPIFIKKGTYRRGEIRVYQKIDEDYKVRMPDYAIKRLGLCKNDIVRFEVVGDAVVMSKAVLDCDNLLQGQNK